MKTSLAWFSPLPPQRTEVANFTERLRPHLDVRYFVDTGTGFLCTSTKQRFHCDPGEIPFPIVRQLSSMDVPIYHLGNNRECHMNTWFLSRAKPGIVVLHDTKLHHFIDAIYKHRLGGRDGYLKLMHQVYGETGSEAAAKTWDRTTSIDAIAARCPLTELAVDELRIWDHALPSLVMQTEASADLPSEAVYFVRPDHESADIQTHLRALLTDAAAFAAKGPAGKRTLERNHAPADYVRALQQITAGAEAFGVVPLRSVSHFDWAAKSRLSCQKSRRRWI